MANCIWPNAPRVLLLWTATLTEGSASPAPQDPNVFWEIFKATWQLSKDWSRRVHFGSRSKVTSEFHISRWRTNNKYIGWKVYNFRKSTESVAMEGRTIYSGMDDRRLWWMDDGLLRWMDRRIYSRPIRHIHRRTGRQCFTKDEKTKKNRRRHRPSLKLSRKVRKIIEGLHLSERRNWVESTTLMKDWHVSILRSV